MSIQLEDIALRLKQQRDLKQTEKIEQFEHQIGVASQMSELKADSKWSIYLGHIEAIASDYERQSKGYLQSLSGAEFLEPRQYGEFKVKLAKSEGFADGLKLATELVAQLIISGEKAAEELVNLTRDKLKS